jgi:hypothetical protein
VDLREERGGGRKEGGRRKCASEWMTQSFTGVTRSTTMKVSFSLAKKPQPTSQFQLKKPPAPTQKPSLFNADDDDDERSLTSDSKPTKNGLGLQTVSAEASKAQKKRELAEMAVDSTVYQYDEVWDKIQVAKQKVKEAKVAESKERKVRPPTLSPHRTCLLTE